MVVIYINCGDVSYGDIYYADLSGSQGSEQGGIRPVLIIQNNTGNRYSPTTIALAITSKMYKANFPTHVVIQPKDSGLQMSSVVLAEQIRTVDKSRLKSKVGHLDKPLMQKIDKALWISCNSGENTPIIEIPSMLVAV